MTRSCWPLLVCLSLGTALAGVASAAQPVPPVMVTTKAWGQLTPQQQQALAPLATEWPQLPAASQQKWLQVAARFPQLDAQEQARVQQRMGDWAHLSPDERLRARIGWQDAQRVDANQRQAKWERYQALPPDARAALQEKAAQRKAPSAGRPLPPPSAAAGLLMVRARLGTTTVPITQKAPQIVTQTRPLSVAGLDPATLLPRPVAPASQP